MTELRQAAEEALEALETLPCGDSYKTHHAAILLIKALAESNSDELQQEPFGIWHEGKTEDESDFFLYKDAGDVSCDKCIKLYTAPPQLEWVGLTGFEQKEFMAMNIKEAVFAIEAMLKEKNHDRA